MALSAIDQAIADAQAAAANFNPAAAAGGTAVAPAQTYAPAVAPAAPAAPLGVDDMLGGALDVKAWLKVSKFGINFGNDLKMFTEIPVTIQMDTIQYCYSVRYGNPAKYDKSYDRVTDTRGRPWFQALMEAKQMDPKAAEFRSADVPFITRQDIVGADGKTIAEAGECVGHSISMTGWKNFQKFIMDAKRAGLDIYRGEINATLKHVYQKNDKGEWGILSFVELAAA